MYYILDENRAVVVTEDVELWGRFFGNLDNRRVAETKLTDDIGISTVFLGLDYDFSRTGPPLVFETMVFGGGLDSTIKRYTTYEQAEAGHEAMVLRVKEILDDT